MSSILRALAVLATGLSLTAGAHAQAAVRSPLYVEVAYTAVKVRFDSGYSALPSALRGIVGYEIHPNFALEGMLALGVAKDDGGTSVATRLSSASGLFIKPKIRLGESTELFARLGYARSKIELSNSTLSASDSDSDRAIGLGLSIQIDPRAAVVVDYTSYYNRDGVKAGGFSAGMSLRF